MARLIDLIRGWAGKPSHPPLTDASIGAYTVGVAMLLAGKLGLQDRQMAYGSLIAISFGLLLAAPTALTGLLDWLKLEKGTPRRTTATVHLVTMVTATLVFAGAWLAQRPGYDHGKIETLGLALGLAAEALLALGLGIAYVGVAVWGFIRGDGGNILGFLPVNTEDNFLHAILGVAGLAAYAATPAGESPTTAPADPARA